MKKPSLKMVKYSLLILFGAFIVIQAVPYGRDHGDPPNVSEPNWDSPGTRALAKRACFDCHSNDTVWPWYASVAPVSWLVYHDVEEGRSKLNFSDWRGGRRDGEKPSEIRKEIDEGDMPPIEFRLLHPEARLTGAEKLQLIDGMMATANRSAL